MEAAFMQKLVNETKKVTMKRLVYLLLLLLSIGTVSVLGYYLFKNSVRPSPSSNRNDNEAPQTTIDWKKETFEITRKKTEIPADLTLKIEMDIPEEWSIKIVQNGNGKENNNTYEECNKYILSSPNEKSQMILEPYCSGWAAEYSKWPSDSVIVKKQKRASNSGLGLYYRIRYTNLDNTYTYIDAATDQNDILDINKNLVMNAILIGHEPPNENIGDFEFIPAKLTAVYQGYDEAKEKQLDIMDHITVSIKLLP